MLKNISLADIVPQGYIKTILQTQASGLSSNIGKYLVELDDNNGWRGGSGERWERGAYYFDGLSALSLLVDNVDIEELKNQYLQYILSSQRSNGDFGNVLTTDCWPKMVITKGLATIYRATNDKAILSFLTKYFTFLIDDIETNPPSFWAYARSLECVEALEIVGGDIEKKAKRLLIKNMPDYKDFYNNFSFTQPTTKYLNITLFNLVKPILAKLDKKSRESKKVAVVDAKKVMKANKSLNNYNFLMTHGVNLVMSLKYLPYLRGNALKAFNALNYYHGNITNVISSDEHLNGNGADCGIELCAVVELMYSLQRLFVETGDKTYIDLLEYVGHNALGATFTEDMTAHQYVQQPNQIACDMTKRDFFDVGKDANLFGVAPNCACCAANMHQGYPKFAQAMYFVDGDKIFCGAYMPSVATIKVKSGSVTIKNDSDYPYEDQIRLSVVESTSDKAILYIRIPFHIPCVVTHNGEEIKHDSKYAIVSGLNIGDSIALTLSPKVSVVNNGDNSISVVRGALIYVNKLAEQEIFYSGKKPYHLRGFSTTQKYNIVPLLNRGKLSIVDYKYDKVDNHALKCEQNKLTVKAVEVINWTKHHGSLPTKLKSPQLKCDNVKQADGATTREIAQTTLTLSPYATTYLRVSQFVRVDIATLNKKNN